MPRNASAWSVADDTAPVSAWVPAGSSDTCPCSSTDADRKLIDERWPSPIPRVLMTRSRLPGAAPDWSGAGTSDGLHRAAASTLYSWVNAAPRSMRRSSVSSVPSGMRLAIRSAWCWNVARRSRWRCSNRSRSSASPSATPWSSRSSTWRTESDTCRPLRGSGCPGTKSFAMVRVGSARRRSDWRTASSGVIGSPTVGGARAAGWTPARWWTRRPGCGSGLGRGARRSRRRSRRRASRRRRRSRRGTSRWRGRRHDPTPDLR